MTSTLSFRAIRPPMDLRSFHASTIGHWRGQRIPLVLRKTYKDDEDSADENKRGSCHTLQGEEPLGVDDGGAGKGSGDENH